MSSINKRVQGYSTLIQHIRVQINLINKFNFLRVYYITAPFEISWQDSGCFVSTVLF